MKEYKTGDRYRKELFDYKEKIRKEKKEKWEKIVKWIDEITDKTGLEMDEEIKPLVCALTANGFNTDNSCEGHADNPESTALPYPWVRIEIPAPKGWRENENIKNEYKKIFAENWKKINGLISDFYRERELFNYDAMIIASPEGISSLSIQCNGSKLMSLLENEEAKKEKMFIYRQELKEFADFLKKRFFEISIKKEEEATK